MHDHLKHKINERGLSQAGIARLLRLPQQVISRWANGHQVPASRVLPLCEIMGWSVTPHEIRPDIYPNPTDGLPLTHEHIISSVKTQGVNNHDHP
ncbi:helix-turn-helix domain-containing protein [Salmonella enterica]|nr:helix-turn-helix domain-containing protein [Salmonella enterica]ECH9715329.1 helix-turn-helix domain-containing protein [Salmonella enterica subsp. enterica serovar Javiana]EGZ4424193.1 helix-turn-helix domain-containing protein [Salmonella enterica subsp. enterica serovar Javiana]